MHLMLNEWKSTTFSTMYSGSTLNASGTSFGRGNLYGANAKLVWCWRPCYKVRTRLQGAGARGEGRLNGLAKPRRSW